MTPQEILACLTIVDEAFDARPRSADATKAKVALWHSILGQFPAKVVLTATRRLIAADAEFAPKPGQIAAEVRRILGREPFTVDEACGLYLTGQKNSDPLVAEAAALCHLDPRRADYSEARWEFRSVYAAVLRKHREADYEPVRAQLGIEAPKVAPVVALPSPSKAIEEPPSRDGLSQVRRLRDELRNRDGDGAA